MNTPTPVEPSLERYISFDGLECDENASRVVEALRQHANQEGIDPQWAAFFESKFSDQKKMGTDDLFFVGSLMNSLYMFLEYVEDEDTRALLYQVEQECC